MLALLHLQSTAFMLAPRAPPQIATSALPPRAAVPSANFGIVNEKDLRKAAAATLASIVILASPTAAFAKGGGHGGGGGGGDHSSHSSYHSSSSSSSSSSATRSLHSYTRYASPKAASARGSSSPSRGRRGSSSSRRGGNGYYSGSSSSSAASAASLAPPPPPALIFPSESKAREQGGYYCPAEPPLPKTGDKLKVAGRKATVLTSTPQVALYGSALQTIPGIDSDCSVTVRYDDDSTTETLSAAEKAQPLWIKYLDIELLGSLYGGMGLMSALEPSFWETEKKRHQAMVEELKASFAALPEELRPKSGEYWGSSEESDDGDQAVRSKITFKANGKVSGRGIDGEDGPYTITQGVWGKRDRDKEHEVTVGWIEDYSEGFLVVVEGFYNTKTGKIEARFRSSRGVSGRFMLAPKPSIFS